MDVKTQGTKPVEGVDKRIKTSRHLNQCAFHVLSPFIHSIFCRKRYYGSVQFLETQPTFQNYYAFFRTKAYPHFISAFAQYYHLKEDRNLWLKIQTFLQRYEHPLDVQVLLGPVLRLTLGRVLKEHETHKSNLKPSFEELVTSLHSAYWQQQSGLKTPEHAALWLENKKWDKGQEFHELFTCNIDLIANIISTKKLKISDKAWDKAYTHYCDYLADPSKGAFISESQLAILAHSFDMNFSYQFKGAEITPIKKLYNPIATVKAMNPTEDHWEIAKQNPKSTWDYDDEHDTQPVFKAFHDACIAFANMGASSVQYKHIQKTFSKEISELIKEKEEYKHQQYQSLPTDHWGNNSALQGIVEIIVEEARKSDKQSAFIKSKGFEDFLKGFAQYYDLDKGLSNRRVVKVFKQMLEDYPSSTDQFLLISPVLRMMVHKRITLENIRPRELAKICTTFNLNLEIYYDRKLKHVSRYDLKHHRINKGAFGTLSVMLNESGTYQVVEKDLDNALLQKDARAFATSPSFSEHASMSIEAVKDLQAKMIQRFKKSKSKQDIKKGSVQEIYQQLNSEAFKAKYKNLIKAIKAKDLNLFAKLLGRYQLSENRYIKLLNLSLKATQVYKDDQPFCQGLLHTILAHGMIKEIEKGEISTPTEKALKVVSAAIEKQCPQWVAFYENFYKELPGRLDRPELSDSALLCQIRILEHIAKTACHTIEEENKTALLDCVRANNRCLLYRGPHNPVHFAVKINKYAWLKEVFVNVYLDNKGIKLDTLDKDKRADTLIEARKPFEYIAQGAMDEYDRSAAYRFARQEARYALDSAYEKANTFGQVLGLSAQYVALNLDDARVCFFDGLYKKMNHQNGVRQGKLFKYGQPIHYAVRSIGIISTAGPIQFAQQVAWSAAPSFVKQPILKGVGEVCAYAAPYVNVDPNAARLYAPYIADNAVTLLIAPQYFLISTVLSAGLYFTFKDRGYDNLESILQFGVDAVSLSLATGSGQNYCVDERYQYQVEKNLTPFFGELAAQAITPVIGYIDTLNNQANSLINYPVDTLAPMVSEALVPVVTNMPDWMSAESIPGASSLNACYQFMLSCQRQRQLWEQSFFNGVESKILNLMGDSAFKSERRYSLQAFQVYQDQIAINGHDEKIDETKKQIESTLEAIEQAEKDLSEGGVDVSQQKAMIEGLYDQLSAFQQQLVSLEEQRLPLEEALNETSELATSLLKETPGFEYYLDWQEKLYAYKLAEQRVSCTPSELEALRAELEEAYQLCHFYNPDNIAKTLDAHQEIIEELFEKCKGNFLDDTNIAGSIDLLVDSVFAQSSDRNMMAKIAADLIIQYKYPFYPEHGDATKIEAERQKYIDHISTNTLDCKDRKPDRAKDYLFWDMANALTGIEKPKRPGAIARVYKHFVNEIVGKSIGYIPYKNVGGGRTQRGSFGLQFSHGGGQQVNIVIAGRPIYTLYDSTRQTGYEFNIQKPKPLDYKALEQNTQMVRQGMLDASTQRTSHEFQSSSGALNTDHPVVAEYMATLQKASYTPKEEEPNVKPKESIDPPRVAASPQIAIQPPQRIVLEDTLLAPLERWCRLFVRSFKGEQSEEISAWKKANREALPRVSEFMIGMSENTMPVKELPRVSAEVAYETILDTMEALESAGNFLNREVIHLVKGEKSETAQALKMLGIFIEEDFGHFKLGEKTQVEMLAKGMLHNFNELSPRDQVKALGKLATSFYLPVAAAGVMKKASKVASKIKELPKQTAPAVTGKVQVEALSVGPVKPIVPLYTQPTSRFRWVNEEVFEYDFRLPNSAYPPNAQVMETMNSAQMSKWMSNEMFDCSEIAKKLFDASGGKGKIFTMEPKVGRYFYAGELDSTQLISSKYKYHTVFRDSHYVYDPRLSSNPIPRGDFQSIVNKLNPQGVRTYEGDPWSSVQVIRQGNVKKKVVKI